jgi:hypothetical protein
MSQVHSEAPSALSELAHLNARDEVVWLLTKRDSAVFDLDGVFFAEVCRRIKADCLAPLQATSKDADPEWRAFACEALGALGDESAVPSLLDRVHDQAALKSAHDNPPVAVVAALALLKYGRCDGVGELLVYAERAEYWHLVFLDELRELSGEDLGTDLKGWSEWFVSHRPECVVGARKPVR